MRSTENAIRLEKDRYSLHLLPLLVRTACQQWYLVPLDPARQHTGLRLIYYGTNLIDFPKNGHYQFLDDLRFILEKWHFIWSMV